MQATQPAGEDRPAGAVNNTRWGKVPTLYPSGKPHLVLLKNLCACMVRGLKKSVQRMLKSEKTSPIPHLTIVMCSSICQ
jgi:hypothetical protein